MTENKDVDMAPAGTEEVQGTAPVVVDTPMPVQTQDAEMSGEADVKEGESKSADMKEGESTSADVKEGESKSDDSNPEPKEEEKPVVPEQPKEMEEDEEPASVKSGVAGHPAMNTFDSHLNLTVHEGNVVSTMASELFTHLYGGIRSDHGVKSGRVYFEAKVLEVYCHKHGFYPNAMIGFATEDAGRIIGSDNKSFGFDYQGNCYNDGKRLQGHQEKVLWHHNVVGVLLNLEPGHANENTYSLFKNGQRITQPKAIPEHLHGQVFYPTITLRGLSLVVNLGEQPVWKDLPFQVRLLKQMEKKQVVASPHQRPKKESYDVIVPICLPGQGGYDLVDQLHEKYPGKYEELSERALGHWAQKSGLPTKTGALDEIAIDGIHYVRDAKKQLTFLASQIRRHVIIMNVQNNLTKEFRQDIAKMFKASRFNTVALVALGEPTKDFLDSQKNLELAVLQKSKDQEIAIKRKALENERAAAQKVREEKRAKRDAAKKVAEEKAAADAEKKEGEEDKKEGEEAKEAEATKEGEEQKDGEEAQAGEKMEVEKEAEEDLSDPVEEPVEVVIPDQVVELPADFRFRAMPIPDVQTFHVDKHFAKYSLPDAEEGFKKIDYSWANADGATAHMVEWSTSKKLSCVVNGMAPNAWYKERIESWKTLEKEFPKKRKAYEVEVAKKKALKEADAEAKKNEAAEEKKEGDAPEGEEKPEEEKKEAEETVQETPEVGNDEFDAKFTALDPMTVEDIDNAVDGCPLYEQFKKEDYTLAAFRCKVHALLTAFKMDQPEHPGIHKDLFADYFKIFEMMPFQAPCYGAKDLEGVMKLLSDTFEINDKGIVVSHHDSNVEVEVFVKLTESERRQRVRKIDAGDESAIIKIEEPQSVTHSPEKYGKGKSYHYQGSYNVNSYKPSYGGYQQKGASKGKGKGKGYQSWGGSYGGSKGGSSAGYGTQSAQNSWGASSYGTANQSSSYGTQAQSWGTGGNAAVAKPAYGKTTTGAYNSSTHTGAYDASSWGTTAQTSQKRQYDSASWGTDASWGQSSQKRQNTGSYGGW